MAALRQLYPSSEDGPRSAPKVDIVAVHGLNPFNKDKAEHAWDTWRKPSGNNGRLWLRDDLPKALPESRIFLCEYDSTVAYDRDRSSFLDKANALLEAITIKRRDANQRPLLFLGHSLGGLLIKQALINAHNNKRYTPIKDATVGVAFFATPHFGGDPTAVRMGNVVAKVAISLGFKAGDNILETLKSGSIFTGIMKEHWRHQLPNYDLRSFWGTLDTHASTYETPLIHYLQVVPSESTQFGMSGTHENVVSLIADHSSVCKFDESQVDRDNYEIVEGNLRELYDLALERAVGPRPQDCLRHPFFTDQDVYKNDLKRRKGDRARGTCEWIIQTDELQKWLGLQPSPSAQSASNVLWLYGNPGTGKSTMAITMVEELPKLPCFINGAKFLAYFFCDSSSKDLTTATSILRNLIYQFITQQPQLTRFLLPACEKEQENLQSFDSFWSILMNIGSDTVTGAKYCIIDALDECDNAWRTLLDRIKRQFKSHTSRDTQPKINILIISRKYPEIERRLREFDSKNLALYPSMADDLDTFIKEKVEELASDMRYPRETAKEVSRILHEKAEKTFLWAGIACGALIDVPSKDAVKKLSSLPQGLEELYKKLLDAALEFAQKEDNLEEITRIVDLVAISRRPLTVLELAEACQLCPDREDDTRKQHTEEHIETCRLMVVIQNDTVQLLHKSVRDFLLGPSSGLPINESRAHASMANRCINFLQRTFRQGGKSEPRHKTDRFLEYALLHWTQHASSAHNDFSVVRETESFFRIASKERETWLRRYRVMRPFEKIPERFSVFHVAARWGIASLVHFALSEISGRDEMQSTRGDDRDIRRYDDSEFVAANRVTPLEEAAREGRTDIIHVLLENALPAMVIRTEVVVAAAANQQNSKALMALLLNERGDQIKVTEAVVKAAAGNRENGEVVMELLLDQRGHQIEITEDVVKAAAGNQTKGKQVMDLLLDRLGHQIKITEDVVKVAAWNRGGKEVMELLLDRRGDEVQVTEDVVKAAAENRGGKEVMELLLDQRGDQIHITEDVVKVAAENRGGEEVMALLLDQRGHQIPITEDVAKIQVTKGVIKAAAGNGRKGKELMALLLGHLGRQIQIEDHELQTAAWKGNIESVEHLLVNGASAASANRCGWTPLNAASWNGDIQVVGLLLAKGAHPTAKSNIGWTPLDAAFAKGRVDTVRLLLPHDPDAAADFTPTSFSDVRKSGVLELDGDKLEVRMCN
ncbi:hypothetical protein CNMCM8980_005445 [Aspergillus fumigatiaffinis]|uniref:NACHT domain-containing protein n=1 Tax=Aspergillus fumigatiaffinis TaxID=340414 RepID=A0A8H4HA34_9EURO|nr:hypothetical protein CNMCM6805_005271 [Aspergillus fumigatiaffinis]KAF4240216.1 hypothetical protein CNMCM6457_007992 [Aspergillus fumigatiaffinis]KAF4248653.1 hypothetical protein CNMCM8980_005445 [Aspergillus fumigatiaffinis]